MRSLQFLALRLLAIAVTLPVMPIALSACTRTDTSFTPREILASDHYDGSRFFNPGVPSVGFKDFLRWRLTGDKQQWPDSVPLAATAKPPARVEGEALRVTMVGHATVLVQTGSLNILTDPVWSDRTSPFSFLGPRRVTPPGIAWADLPKIDIVLVSHNHYDHLDTDTLAKLVARDAPLIVTPLGNGQLIADNALGARIVELDWNEAQVEDAVTITLLPAQHWSSRWGFDRNKALWGAFVIKPAHSTGGSIYFAGDTGYGPHFTETAKAHGPFRLALLPIGAFAPRWFMGVNHMGPDDAVRAWNDLGQPATTIPIHFETVQLTDESYEAPLKVLGKTPGGERFIVLHAGQEWDSQK